MPAETHQRSEAVDIAAVLDLLAFVVGLDADRAAEAPLADLELNDDLSILHLWDAVVEEYGERSVGDLELDGTLPTTLGELADLFTRESHVVTADETAVTEISIAGANCPWCFNDTLDVLRHEPGVVSVVASITGQCLRVEHHGVAIDRLLAVVRGQLHADDTTSTEHVMVAIDPLVADLHCTHRHSTNPDRTPDV